MPTPSYVQAKRVYDQGKLPQAALMLRQDLRRDPNDADVLQLLGAIEFQTGRPAEGRRLAERAVEIDPDNSEAWNSLGLILHLTGENDEALEAFARATNAEPKHGGAWMNRGFVLQELGRHDEAIAFFDRALEVGFTNSLLYFFLGNAYAALGQHAKALGHFNETIARAKGYGDAWNNRGTSLIELGRVQEGIASLQEAARLSPKNPLVPVNLAQALQKTGRGGEALAMLDEQIRQGRAVDESTSAKADILIEQEKPEEAIGVLASAKPTQHNLAVLARAHQYLGAWRQSLEISSASTDPILRIINAVTMPVVLESASMVLEARDHLRSAVARIRESPVELVDPLKDISLTMFYLAYQGVGERDLQEMVAAMYRESYPILRFEIGHTPSTGSRIRLGVLSAHLRRHTIGKLFAGLFENLDKDRFEIVYLQLGKSDATTERLAQHVDRHVLLPRSFSESVRQIAEEKLDILFYPDVGMDHHSFYLAYARLAPVQCVMWGHPMTTGSPAMDYFVSSRHLERDDADVEYTEKLARLPSLTTYFRRPPVPPPLTKADFGLPEDARLYACLQSIFKFHPDFDRVLAAILDADHRGRLLMISPKHHQHQDLLVARWERTYPVIAERAIFFSSMDIDRYLALNALSDAILDPIQFGGGNSSLECFAVGAPVVTLPFGLLRNQITTAAYRQIGFEDLIAKDEDDYVRLANRLATDTGWRNQMREDLLNAADSLYESGAAVEELTEFLSGIAPR